jgi:glycosyltransferase involved in cell wall biosynthesis
LKIAYLVGSFPNTRETFVLNEIIDLIHRGVEVDVFSWSIPNGYILHPEARDAGVLSHVHYFRYRHLLNVTLSFTFWRTLLWAIARHGRKHYRTWRDKLHAAYLTASLVRGGYRHLHAHFAVVEPIARQAGITYSFMAHCYNEEAMGEAGKAKLRMGIEEAAFVTAASDFVRKGLCSVVDERHKSKIRLIRCGIDGEQFSPVTDADKDIDVICVAGFSRSKGLEYLIRAIGLIKKSGHAVRVMIVGGGNEDAKNLLLHEQTIANVDDMLEFTGPVDSETVRQLLARSKMFALPSIVTDEGEMDGLPVALMEAAAMGLPMISTSVAGIPELVRDGVTGLVVPQRDPAALADAILTLLHDQELRERFGKAARQRVLAEFTREESGRRLEQYFRALMT